MTDIRIIIPSPRKATKQIVQKRKFEEEHYKHFMQKIVGLTLSICTAFFTMRIGGGSGALDRNSAMVQVIGASSLVCRQSS